MSKNKSQLKNTKTLSKKQIQKIALKYPNITPNQSQQLLKLLIIQTPKQISNFINFDIHTEFNYPQNIQNKINKSVEIAQKNISKSKKYI